MSRTTRISIEQDGRAPRTLDLKPGVYPIGADDGNRLRIVGEQVAWRHAILTIRSSGAVIEDLGSESGTKMDQTRIQGRCEFNEGSVIEIGPARIRRGDAPAKSVNTPAADAKPPPKVATRPEAAPRAAVAPMPKPSPDDEIQREIRRQVHTELLKRLDIKRLTAGHIGESDLQSRAKETIEQIIADVKDRLPAGRSPARLAKEVFDEAIGLGPLEDLVADPDITEIMVNGSDRIYVERDGRIERTHLSFLNDDSVHAIIERIVSPIGRRIDESQPYVDARLPDGSRVNAIIPPLSLIGPCLTIRKFSKDPYTIEDLIRFGSMDPRIAKFIQACVLLRKNIVVSGGTGSGKTTLLNVISSYLPLTERIVTIEDAAELRLSQDHVVRLESRPPNIEGRGAITIRDLVRNALRMRPDRIVVGECRGGEALDMLQAMNTGHEGSLTTVHANSPRDAMSRLETMVLMSGMELPLRAIREQTGAAIHLIVQISRFPDGTRKLTKVTEVAGLEGDRIVMQDIFEYKQTCIDTDGRVLGGYAPTGNVPTFLDELETRGITFDRMMFDPNLWT